MYKATNDVLNLIKTFEGCKLTAYQDQRGILTIGVGHTGPEVCEGMTITDEQALTYLTNDMATAVKAVNHYVIVPLTQNQFDALASLAYNIGAEAFRSSTLVRLLNQGFYQQAAEQFLVWDKVNKEQDDGLLRRRRIERALFLTA